MAVGAHEVTLRQLLVKKTGAPAPSEASEVVDLRSTGPVVERHGGWMEKTAAIHARITLQLTHTRDQSFGALSSLEPSKITRGGVVLRVPRAAAFLAPALQSLAASVELTFGLEETAQ